MSEPIDEQLTRVEAARSTAAFVHEVAWTQHERLAETGRASVEARRLLGRSAQIVLVEMPAILEQVRVLHGRWLEQQVLDPKATGLTATELAAELDRVLPRLARVRDEQDQIAARLRELVAGSD